MISHATKDLADAGSDYVSRVLPLVFPDGSTDGARQCVNITVIDDSVYEPDETFTVRLTAITSRVETANAETTITITDDEG